MITVLVTGGCGFIGSNFIKHILKNRPDVRVINLDKLTYAGNLDNLTDIEHDARYQFIRGDICDKQVVNRVFWDFDIDWVVNFAAESHVDRSIVGPDVFLNTNIFGTFILLEAAKRYWLGRDNKRFEQISTDEVYGSLNDGLFTETTPYDPSSPYSASKASADHLVNAYHRTYSLPTVITNSSNNYGPYQFPEKLMPLIINNAIKGKTLPVYGDGKNVRDWVYVEDNCSAILAVLERGTIGEKYNIGANCEKQNIEVVVTICEYLDKELGLVDNRPRTELIEYVFDRPGHDQRYAIDSSKIRSIQWNPSVTFEEGIAKTVRWYLNNRKWIEDLKKRGIE